MSNVSEGRIAGQCGRAVPAFLALVLSLPLTQAQPPAAPLRPLVEVQTERGTFILALFNETPTHRDNFLKLVREQAYDSLLFHRVIPGFMVQGGDPDSKRALPGEALGQGEPGYTLPTEIVAGAVHTRGALAAARQSDQVNPERRSSGSQFYIVQGKTFQADELAQVAERGARMGTPISYTAEQVAEYAQSGGAPHLDGAYTVFGEVVEGMEVIDAISQESCDGRDRPIKDIRMFMRVME
ncbi:MAG: peptidylprolyl isomerase [Flavobacteriales bacterium]|nr:peptidylprolyl isomerase [Flavobacteriales bacterium]